MSLDITNKKFSYEQVYINLTSIQRNYNNIIQYLSKKIGESIPSSLSQVEDIDMMERQIKIASELNVQIEELKYYCSLSFLTDGILSSEEEISYALDILDSFLTTIEIELRSDEAQVREWARVKKEHLEDIKHALLLFLGNKISRQINLNKREVH